MVRTSGDAAAAAGENPSDMIPVVRFVGCSFVDYYLVNRKTKNRKIETNNDSSGSLAQMRMAERLNIVYMI
jgi:hypothetical protein